MPTVSICLPVYNGARYLAEAIESALNQTYEDFELLIADDCSADDSPNIIERYSKRDQRITTWRNQSNLGLFQNYNACVSRASGKYIKLFAQDDIFHPELIDRLVNVLENNPSVSLAASARTPIDAEGRSLELKSEFEKKWAQPFSQDTILSASEAISAILRDTINWLGEPSSQMYRADSVCGGFDLAFRQTGDLEHSFRLLQSGDYYFINDALCLFRKHTGSSSASHHTQMETHLEWLLLASKYHDYLTLAGLTVDEFCLNFIKSWTRDLECELNGNGRLSAHERIAVLHELSGHRDLLSCLTPDNNSSDQASKYKVLSALALLQSTLLENELRTIHREIAHPYDETETETTPLVEVRPGLAAAIAGLKQTLCERDKEIASLRSKLNQMGGSASWKITAPLRALKKRLEH